MQPRATNAPNEAAVQLATTTTTTAPCGACAILSRQTPGNIVTKGIHRTKIRTSPLKVHYDKVGFTYKEKTYGSAGSYVPDDAESNYIIYNGTRYNLKQFHYHAKSEHKIDGEEFDYELHFVHANPNYNKKTRTTNYNGMTVESIDSNEYVVIGLLFSKNKSSTSLFRGSFDEAFSTSKTHITLDLKDLNRLSYFNFPGSLTTAPFSSTITWFLSDDIIKTNIVEFNPERTHPARPTQRDMRDTALYFTPND